MAVHRRGKVEAVMHHLGIVAAVLLAVSAEGQAQAATGPGRTVTSRPVPLEEPVATIEAAYPLDDGRFVVIADPRSSDPIVVVVEASGAQRRIGRVGDGPGEFRRINTASLYGDSLALFDRTGYRLVLLSLESGDGRSVHLDRDRWRSGCTPFQVLPDGVICRHQITTSDGRTVIGHRLHWLPNGARLDTAQILFEARSDSSRFLRMRGGLVGLERYLAWTPRSAQSPSLRMFAVLEQERLGGVDSFRVATTNLPSGIRHQWRSAVTAIVPTRGQRAALIDREMAAVREGAALAGRPDEVPDRRALERAFALPETLPGYRAIHVGDDGCAWLRRTTADVDAQDPREYHVRDFSGRWLATVQIPYPIRLSGVNCREALGIEFDEEEGPTLVRITFST